MDTHARSVAKTLTWRAVATVMTFVVSYLWLEDVASSMALAAAANLAKSFAYYAHERGWNAWSWAIDAHVETRLRSVVKSMLWRAIATAITLGVSFFWLHDLRDTASFVGVSMAVNVLLFYVHERMWNTVQWGRLVPHRQRPTASPNPIGHEVSSHPVVAGD